MRIPFVRDWPSWMNVSERIFNVGDDCLLSGFFKNVSLWVGDDLIGRLG
jgi:hypothetical protein